MPLAEPRKGGCAGISPVCDTSEEFTPGNPENNRLAVLCSRSAGEWYALNAHGISHKKRRRCGRKKPRRQLRDWTSRIASYLTIWLTT
jgi:hypothetical protein